MTLHQLANPRPAGRRPSTLCYWVLALTLLTGTVAQAEPAAAPTIPEPQNHSTASSLSLQQCLDQALSSNRSRSASRLGVEIAETQHRQALSAYWPQLTASARYSIMDNDPNFSFAGTSVQIPGSTIVAQTPLGPLPVQTPELTVSVPQQNVKLMDRKHFQTSLNATLPLYTGGQVGALVRQAEQGIAAARQEARRTDLQLTYDVTRYYHGAVLANNLVQVARDALARMEVTLELTESLYSKGSGRVKKTDYLRNKSVVEWLRSVVSELEANERLAKAALINSMGAPWGGDITLSQQELPHQPIQCDLGSLVVDTYRFNPDWARMEAGLQAALAQIDEAQSGHLPKLALFGNLTHMENSYNGGIVTGRNKDSWTVGLGLELPIFNGLRSKNQVQEARLRLQKLKEQQVLLRDGLALQVQHVVIRLNKAQEQKVSAQAAASSAEENRALNERAYQEELVETKDLIEAQLVESLMKAQYLKALYDHLEARAALDFVVGSSLENLLHSGS